MLEQGDVVTIVEGDKEVRVECIAVAKSMPSDVLKWKVLKMGSVDYIYEWPLNPLNRQTTPDSWLLVPLKSPRVKTGQLEFQSREERRTFTVALSTDYWVA